MPSTNRMFFIKLAVFNQQGVQQFLKPGLLLFLNRLTGGQPDRCPTIDAKPFFC